ncbi:MAG: DNA polymerase III subunit beta [Clostridiales bacterium]|nr:DNA polymerase III subunit beta [Clostridiales bacterium]
MRFTCSTQQLIERLQIVTKAISARTTNPALEGILVETERDNIVLTCSDERITIVTRMQAEIKEAGRGIVPGKMFSEIVRRLPEDSVTISMNERMVFNIRSGSSKSNLSGMDADLFPQLPQLDDVNEIALPQDMLRDMIQKTEFAIATEDAREVLTGSFLEIKNGTVSMVALDGYRLALKRDTCGDAVKELSAIIPGRAIGDIGKLLSDKEDAFAVLSFSGNKLHIRLEDTEIFIILISGEYIDYHRILPAEFATRVTVELEPLRRCIDRAALFARDGNNNLLVLRIHDGTLVIEAHSQIGDVHEELYTEQEGADLNIAFNVRYMTDVVRYIDAERIELKMNSPIAPCIISPVGDPDYLHLVLPVRTGATN